MAIRSAGEPNITRSDQIHSYHTGLCVAKCRDAANMVSDAGIHIDTLFGDDSESIRNLAIHVKDMANTLREVADTISKYKFDSPTDE